MVFYIMAHFLIEKQSKSLSWGQQAVQAMQLSTAIPLVRTQKGQAGGTHGAVRRVGVPFLERGRNRGPKKVEWSLYRGTAGAVQGNGASSPVDRSDFASVARRMACAELCKVDVRAAK